MWCVKDPPQLALLEKNRASQGGGDFANNEKAKMDQPGH